MYFVLQCFFNRFKLLCSVQTVFSVCLFNSLKSNKYISNREPALSSQAGEVIMGNGLSDHNLILNFLFLSSHSSITKASQLTNSDTKVMWSYSIINWKFHFGVKVLSIPQIWIFAITSIYYLYLHFSCKYIFKSDPLYQLLLWNKEVIYLWHFFPFIWIIICNKVAIIINSFSDTILLNTNCQDCSTKVNK